MRKEGTVLQRFDNRIVSLDFPFFFFLILFYLELLLLVSKCIISIRQVEI